MNLNKKQNHTVRDLISKFTGLMWLSMLVVVVAAVNITMRLDEKRRLPADLDTLESQILSNQQMVDELNAVAILPQLNDSWRTLSASVHFTQIELTPIDNAGNINAGNTYVGPLKNWKGTLLGKPVEVIALAKVVQKKIPLFLYDYTVVGGIMKLNFVVVGS